MNVLINLSNLHAGGGLQVAISFVDELSRLPPPLFKYSLIVSIQVPGSLENLWKGSQFSHQAAFIATKTHKKIKYKSTLKYAADFQFFYGLYIHGHSFKYLPVVFAKVIGGGVSDTNRIVVINEFKSISCSNGFLCNLFFLYVIGLERIKFIIKKAIY